MIGVFRALPLARRAPPCRSAAAAAAAAAPWSLKLMSRRALPWPLGCLGVAWVMREGAQHKKVERVGKSVGRVPPTANLKTREFDMLNSKRTQVGQRNKVCCIVQ